MTRPGEAASRFAAGFMLAKSSGGPRDLPGSPCTSARASATSPTGEVLVTRTVSDLVAGSGIAFEERGEHELKGVPETWALYAATG